MVPHRCRKPVLCLLMLGILDVVSGSLGGAPRSILSYDARKRNEVKDLWVRRGGYAPPRGDWNSGSYYEEDEEFVDDRGYYGYDYEQKPKRKAPTRSRGPPMASSIMDAQVPPQLRRFGLYCLFASAALTAVGVSLFFERNLLRLSNLCLMVGLPLKFGPGRVVKMLINPEKMRASGCFVLGMILVLRGNSFLGSLLELFGFLNLFLNLFPFATMALKNMPFVGNLMGTVKKTMEPTPSRYPPRQEQRYGEQRYGEDEYDYNDGYYRR